MVFEAETLSDTKVQDPDMDVAIKVEHGDFTWDAPPPEADSKKKGKKSAPRQRQVRITNTHLKGTIDLSRDYVAPGATPK